MKASVEYLNFVLEKLSQIGDIKSRAMFGGYGIFHEGIMFGIISADTLYFKVNDSNHAAYEGAGSRPFTHSRSYYEVPADVLDDAARLHDWAQVAIAVGHVAAKKKRR